MNLFIEKLTPFNNSHIKLVENDLRDFKVDVYKNFYPKVYDWYETKLIKGFENGSRIIRVVRDSSNLYGISIIRVDEVKKQNKLCTFFLLSEARKIGLGKELLRLSLEDLKKSSPNKTIIVTIPQERIKERFNGKTLLDFFEEYNFKLSGIIPNRYRLKKDEYVCEKVPKLTSIYRFNQTFLHNPRLGRELNVNSSSIY